MSKTPMESKDDQHQFWQMAIETWRSSGLTIRQFCKQEGLSEPSFYSWRKRLAPVKSSEADNMKRNRYLKSTITFQNAL